MAKKKTLTFDELLKSTEKLSKSEMRKLVTHYARTTNAKVDNRINKIILLDLEERLKELDINNTCPKCGSKLIKCNGKRETGIQRLKCNDCGHRFTYFTGTILEKTKYHWDLWVDVIFYMLNDFSIKSIKSNLESNLSCVGITEQSIFDWKHKILDACKGLDLPELHGVIQIDETHFHEAQKGSRSLINLYDKTVVRKPRYTYKPSKYGVMGAEFATVICAIDRSGHAIFKVSGLGKFDIDKFEQLFHPYIQDVSYLCTDANNVYLQYSAKYGIDHYVRPSDYVDILLKCKSPNEIEKKYLNNELDYMAHRGRNRPSYKKMEQLKKDYGLNLALVNQTHERLKLKLVRMARSVSTKHLDSYVAWCNMLVNFRADFGHTPINKEDAEKILIMILKSKQNLLVKELRNKQLNIEKPSPYFLKKLKSSTDTIRSSGRDGFIFDSESIGNSLSVPKQLENMRISWLIELAKECKIKGYTKIKEGHTYKYRKELEKIPNIEQHIIELYKRHGKTIHNEKDL